MSEIITAELVVGESQLESVRASIAAHGGEVTETSHHQPDPNSPLDNLDAAFEPSDVLTISVAVTWVANWVVTTLRRSRHSGVVIDATSGPARIVEHGAVEPGTVLVITSSGSEQYDSRSNPDLAAILDRVLKK